MGEQTWLALNFPGELLDFLLVHSPSMLKVPLLQKLNHSVLMLVQYENRDFPLLLFVLQLILLSPQGLDLPLLFIKESLVNPRFELELVFVVQRIEFEEAFGEILDSLDLVDGVVVLGLGGFERMVDLSVPLEELGLAVDFVGNVFNNLGVF